MKTNRLQVRVDPEVLRKARRYAARTGTTVSRLTHTYLEELAAACDLMSLEAEGENEDENGDA